MSEGLSPEALAAIKERESKATPGPWVADEAVFDITTSPDENGFAEHIVVGHVDKDTWQWESGEDGLYTIGRPENREFVAHSRQDVPTLVAEVERLQKQLSETRKWYGSRYERLGQLAREELSEPQQIRVFNILANGSADCMESPVHDEPYNIMKHRAEAAEKKLGDAAMLIRRLCYKLGRALPDSAKTLIDQANGWLKRMGLQGSILREESSDA